MAEITRHRSGELMRGIFEILVSHPEGLGASEVLRQLEKRVPPTEFEKATYPKNPDVRRFEKIARFSTIGPVKAGWLVKDKGQWSLTEEGREALRRFTDPEAFSREAGRLYRKWKRVRDEAGEEYEAEEVEVTTNLEKAEEAAWTGIQDHLKSMNPYDFQDLVAGLLRAMGYHVSWISPPGPDKGIDIIAHGDPLGLAGPRIKIQVKRRADRTDVGGLRSFMALLGESDVGLFISTGGFTADSETEARGQEKRRIMLVNLKRLFDLWVEHYDRIPEAQRRLLPLRLVHYLAPED